MKKPRESQRRLQCGTGRESGFRILQQGGSAALCLCPSFSHFIFITVFPPLFLSVLLCSWASQVALVVKNLPANAGDVRDTFSIPESGRSPERGHGHPLQYSRLETPRDRGAQRAVFQRVGKSQTTDHVRTHTRTHTRTHMCTHMCTHARTHTQTHVQP